MRSQWASVWHLWACWWQFFATWPSHPHDQHTPSHSLVFPQSHSSEFLPWPLHPFSPSSWLFMYRADSVRLCLDCLALTCSLGAAMSNLFTLNCVNTEVISLSLSFLVFLWNLSTVWTGCHNWCSPIMVQCPQTPPTLCKQFPTLRFNPFFFLPLVEMLRSPRGTKSFEGFLFQSKLE